MAPRRRSKRQTVLASNGAWPDQRRACTASALLRRTTNAAHAERPRFAEPGPRLAERCGARQFRAMDSNRGRTASASWVETPDEPLSVVSCGKPENARKIPSARRKARTSAATRAAPAFTLNPTTSAIAQTAQRARRTEPIWERPISCDRRRRLPPGVLAYRPPRASHRFERQQERPRAALENNASSRTPQRYSVDLIRYTQPTRLLIAVRLTFLHCRQTAVKGFAAIPHRNAFAPS